MKESFINPLLHPHATSPITSPTMLEYDDMSWLDTPVESLEHLPIASRFLSPTGLQSDTPTALDHVSQIEDKDAPNIDSESLNYASKHNHPHSPYGPFRLSKTTSVPFPSRSHQSLPPPPLPNLNAVSTQSLGRKNPVKADLIANGDVAPHQLPDDLRQCLEVIEDSILAGHVKLSECLRKRYDQQYPLVRSLADIFATCVRLFIFPSCCRDHRAYLDFSLTFSGVM
jgi:hypothetical protein